MHGRDVEPLYRPGDHPAETLIVEIKSADKRTICVYEQRPWYVVSNLTLMKAMALAELTDEQYTALGREVLGPC